MFFALRYEQNNEFSKKRILRNNFALHFYHFVHLFIFVCIFKIATRNLFEFLVFFSKNVINQQFILDIVRIKCRFMIDLNEIGNVVEHIFLRIFHHFAIRDVLIL